MYQTNRMRFNSTRYKRKRSSAGYPYKRPNKGRAIVSQGGVGGGVQRMTAGLPPPPEIKTSDTIVTATTTGTGDWTVVSPSTIFPAITQGAAPNQRIGRKIRVVGIVLRLDVVSLAVTTPDPFTMDLLWDKQPNGAQALVTNIYTGASSEQLPNSNFTERFTFIKRFKSDPSRTSPSEQIDYSTKCNKVVSFDTNTGLIGDVEQNNLILTLCSTTLNNQAVQGILRILYVDA